MSRQLKVAEELENTYVNERVAYLLPQFEAIAPYKITQRKKGTKELLGWEKLAAQEARLLKINYPDDKPEEEKTYGTCLRQITALKKELKTASKTNLKDPALYHPVNTIITHFGEALSYQFASYKEKQNTKYRQEVKDRSQPEARVELDLSKYLERAHDLLKRIAKGDEEGIDWRDISCAIALGTGRRMAEVHLSATFKQLDTHLIGFAGQLKGKTRRVDGVNLRNVVFEIPTLLPADLVCVGLQWLEDRDKRFDKSEDTERVNRRWSKVLNEAAKDWAIIPDMTYHKFRGAYLRASIVNSGIDPFDYLSYAQRILGDDDESTIKAYQRFTIKPGTTTQI